MDVRVVTVVNTLLKRYYSIHGAFEWIVSTNVWM